MATTTDLTTLKINYLTQAQYDTALANNQINANELYFTPADNGITLNLNGQSTQSPSFYAPMAGGTADTQALVSNGANNAPKWVNISPSISITAGTSSAAPKINTTVLGQSGTAASITTATTGVYGVTKLSSTASSSEQGLAATPKLVYDSIAALDVSSAGNTNGSKYIAAISETDGKISATAVDVATTYSSTGTTAISGTGVAAALGTLDVNAVGVAAATGNRYISQISETDGKINAVLATATLGSSTQPIWIDSGTIKATSYSLSATINASGNANKIAYYSGTNTISAGSITTDGNYIEFSNGDYGIQRVGRSKQWRQGRDGALVKTTSLPSTAYSPILSAKTTNGSWEIGTYDNTSYTDDLIFTYITDENYNNSNTRTAQIKFSEDSYISGNGFKITNVVGNDNQSYGNLSIEVLGTTSATGISTLELGNNIASGSNKNAQGKIRIYSTNTNGMSITTASLSASRTAILPDANGWIAIGGNGSTTGVAGADQIMYLSTSGVLTAGTSATNTNTVNTIVKRDSSGNFSAGSITAATKFIGNLDKKIDLTYDGDEQVNNVSFNNSADVTFSLAGFVRGVDDSTIVTPSSSYLPLTGGTMTGSLIASASTSTRQVRNITYSTSTPTSSDGQVGDIWLVYTA